jgi:UDPglucose 6-dehydrogenase
VESLKSTKGLRVHDPYLEEISGVKTVSDAKKALEGADLAIFMVAHKGYEKLTPTLLKKLMRTPVVIDGRNLFSMDKMTRAGIIYAGVGKRSVLSCKAKR